MSPHDQALSVLSCPACGSAVAIARQERARCAFCQAEVPVPEAYRAALDVAEREVAADALTHEAFRTLGAPPSVLLRIVDALTRGIGGVLVTTLFTIIVAAHAIDWALDHAQPWFHVNAWDFISPRGQSLLWWGLIFSILCAVYALGAFGRRRAIDLRGLHQALAAHPAARPGGPARCRDCGAPLTIPDDALGVRCAYCKADNLVAIPADWLARAKRGVANITREAKSAFAGHRAETRRLRVRLALRLGILSVIAALVVAFSLRQVRASTSGDFDLAAALAPPRTLFDLQPATVLLGTPDPAAPRVPIDRCASPYLIHRGTEMTCLDGDCFVGWFVALRAGESFTIAPRADGIARLYAHLGNRGWNAAYGRAELWGTELAHAPVAAGAPARFTAPDTSWYRVRLELRDVGDALEVCATIP